MIEVFTTYTRIFTMLGGRCVSYQCSGNLEKWEIITRLIWFWRNKAHLKPKVCFTQSKSFVENRKESLCNRNSTAVPFSPCYWYFLNYIYKLYMRCVFLYINYIFKNRVFRGISNFCFWSNLIFAQRKKKGKVLSNKTKFILNLNISIPFSFPPFCCKGPLDV